MTRLRLLVRRLHRTFLARRRPFAALFAALAVAAALQAHRAPPPEVEHVLTAARDLPAGAALAPTDLALAGFPPGSVPDGVVSRRQALGQRTVGPIRAGEPLTDVRILGAGLIDRFPGMVAAPVRIGDAASVALLRVGDRISVLAADPQGAGDAVTVAENATVIAVPPRQTNDAGLSSGALVVLAVPPETGRRLAGAGVSAFLSLLIIR